VNESLNFSLNVKFILVQRKRKDKGIDLLKWENNRDGMKLSECAGI
jgi:hypothetical protein